MLGIQTGPENRARSGAGDGDGTGRKRRPTLIPTSSNLTDNSGDGSGMEVVPTEQRQAAFQKSLK